MDDRAVVPQASGHSQSVQLYQNAPRWFEIHEQQSVGRFVGGLAASVGAVGLGISLLGKSEKPGVVAAVGAALSGLGIWLLRKKYFRDPEALREYLLKFKRLSIASNIQEFGWDNIFSVASPELFVEKLMSEIGPDKIGFDDVFLLYGVTNMEKMLQLSLVHPQLLQLKLQVDLAKLAETPVVERPLIKRLQDYGKFLVETLRVEREYLSHAFISDPVTQRMSFEDLITHGARDLLALHIVKLEFLNNKFLTEVRAGSWTWSNIQAKFGPWILDDGIALPEDLAGVFRSAFFTASFTDILADYWAWPIQKYGMRLSIQPDEYQKLLELKQEWETLKVDYDQAVKTAIAAAQREEFVAGTKFGQSSARVQKDIEKEEKELLSSTSGNTTMTPEQSVAHAKRVNDLEQKKKALLEEYENEMKAAVAKSANARDKTISELDSKLAENKARINKDWMRFIGAKFNPNQQQISSGSGTNINITLNLGGTINNQQSIAGPQAVVASAPPM